MPLEYVLIPWVFVRRAISLDIIIYLSYIPDISLGLFVNCQTLSQQVFLGMVHGFPLTVIFKGEKNKKYHFF